MSIRNLLEKVIPQSPPVAADAALGGETVLPTDTSKPARVGLWVLGVGFGGFLLWAGFAPLDEGVPTQGMVSIDTKRKTVQHLSGGIVKQVFVKEGQFVKTGDPLLRIDDAVSQANYESVRQHYLTLRAMEGRLLAEQTGTAKIAFHDAVTQATSDSFVQEIVDNQVNLFHSRRNALQADIQATQEAMQGQKAAIQGYEGMLASRKSQYEFIQEELKGIRELVQEGYAPRSRQLELERMAAEALGSMADLQGNIQRAKRAVGELSLRVIQRKQEYQKEVSAQLADVRREVQADADKFKASGEELARTTIRAPVEGQVLGLVAQSVGGVITPGQKLMDIVPQHEGLLLEAKVPPHMIDRVRPGLETDIRFSTFAHSPSLVVQGRVDSISSDLITEQAGPQGGFSYYLARVSLTPDGIKELGNRQLQAGMPAEVVIRTGERTVLTYLLHPFLKRIAASMKEE